MGSHIFSIEWRHWECCTSWPWPTFSRSRIFKSEYLDQRISQTAKDSRRQIPMDFQSGVWKQDKLIFSPNIIFLFRLFQVEWKTRIVNFLANCSTNSRYLWIVIKVLEVYKMCAVWMAVAAQLSLNFPDGKCITWKKEITLNISDNI